MIVWSNRTTPFSSFLRVDSRARDKLINPSLFWPVCLKLNRCLYDIHFVHHYTLNPSHINTEQQYTSFMQWFITNHRNQEFDFGFKIQNTIRRSRPLRALKPPPLQRSCHLERVTKRINQFHLLHCPESQFEVRLFLSFCTSSRSHNTWIQKVKLIPISSFSFLLHFLC